jgi:hypothetical protein
MEEATTAHRPALYGLEMEAASRSQAECNDEDAGVVWERGDFAEGTAPAQHKVGRAARSTGQIQVGRGGRLIESVLPHPAKRGHRSHPGLVACSRAPSTPCGARMWHLPNAHAKTYT